MSNTYRDLQKSHPCFGGQKNNVGRIHLPVSPGCNIACRFSDRVIEINGDHIETIAKTVSEAGASIYNIIPLIPQADLKDRRAPVCAEIDAARSKAGKYIDVFRHCKHCRADAVGVPGKSEYGDQIYQKRLEVKETFSHG